MNPLPVQMPPGDSSSFPTAQTSVLSYLCLMGLLVVKMAFEQISIQSDHCFLLIEKEDSLHLTRSAGRADHYYGAIPTPGSASSIDLPLLTPKASRDTAINNEQQPLHYQLAPHME